jgi:hypothetical protein
MNEPLLKYQSYLLRLWQPDRKANWRIMVESVGSGERQSFSDMESLYEFLKTRTDKRSWFAFDLWDRTSNDSSVKMHFANKG